MYKTVQIVRYLISMGQKYLEEVSIYIIPTVNGSILLQKEAYARVFNV